MDIEEIANMGARKEHYVFIDSNDARFAEGVDTRIFDPDTQSYVIYRDTTYQRLQVEGGNPANAYRLTFQQPFYNVISLEIMEAYLPVRPLLTSTQYNAEDASYDPLRYVTMRIPEIETHMHRNKKDINWPYGMARISWDTLTDKQNIVYKKPFKQMREFHPIGKLQHITVEFLKNNTTEYVRFKGFHHHFLISVVTMEPEKAKPTEFPQAPHYDPTNPGNGYISNVYTEEESDDDLNTPGL